MKHLGIVHPKMTIKSSFTHPGVVLMKYPSFFLGPQKENLKCNVPLALIHIMTVNNHQHQAFFFYRMIPCYTCHILHVLLNVIQL